MYVQFKPIINSWNAKWADTAYSLQFIPSQSTGKTSDLSESILLYVSCISVFYKSKLRRKDTESLKIVHKRKNWTYCVWYYRTHTQAGFRMLYLFHYPSYPFILYCFVLTSYYSHGLSFFIFLCFTTKLSSAVWQLSNVSFNFTSVLLHSFLSFVIVYSSTLVMKTIRLKPLLVGDSALLHYITCTDSIKQSLQLSHISSSYIAVFLLYVIMCLLW
jgi:hypothetical protein